jgi:hypothetical protein
MDANEFLKKILEGQDLAEDSPELNELRGHREDVETVLCNAFGSGATVRYGGSKAKGTLIRESYDLDLAFYFPHEASDAGATLNDIYESVKQALEKSYLVDPKRTALRLKSKDPGELGRDFHIDVVPGRFVDDSKTDCFLHQENGDKARLKTNLDVHIAHVRASGVIPAIRLLKLWKARLGLGVKQFVYELLIIKILKDKKNSSLSSQLETVWQALNQTADPMIVEDPANPTGNDLSSRVAEAWPELLQASNATLDLLKRSGWEAIFGPVPRGDDEENPQKEPKKDAPPVVLPGPPPSRPRRDRDDRPPQPDRRHG